MTIHMTTIQPFVEGMVVVMLLLLPGVFIVPLAASAALMGRWVSASLLSVMYGGYAFLLVGMVFGFVQFSLH